MSTNVHKENATEVAFSSLDLAPELLQALDALAITTQTETQQACLPALLSGKDAAVKAKTGSGKTFAFGLTLLNQLIANEGADRNTFALVLCPTRELAQQVAEQIRLLLKFHANTKVLTLVGGVPIGAQINSLVHIPDVVVGTPGRVLDLMLKQKLSLEHIKVLVLDEADRMLDMGFSDQVQSILQALPKAKQSMLFSATFGGAIEKLSAQYLNDAQIIEVADNSESIQIVQRAYELQDERVMYAVAAVLSTEQAQSCMIFCQTKQGCRELAHALVEKGFAASALHGDLTQSERDQVLMQFACEACNVLVATDVAARGIDLTQVDLVINANIADSPQTHTHRVGRTGRADKSGLAITLVTSKQKQAIEYIAEQTNTHIPVKGAQTLRFHANRVVLPAVDCVLVHAGKKLKISKGDLLGALIKQAELPKEDIGRMFVTRDNSYIAIKKRSTKRALAHFREHRVKGKQLRARKLKN